MKTKIINIIISILAVLSSLSIVIFAMKYDPSDPSKSDFFQSFSMFVTYGLILAGGIILLGFVIYQLIKNFKQAKGGIIGVGVLVGLFIITYFLSFPQHSLIEQKFEVSDNISRVIGAGLLSTYIMIAGVILAILWTVLASRFKN